LGVCDGCGQIAKDPECIALETLLARAKATAALYEAVKYTLDRSQTDPDLGYYLGPGMQAFFLLCKAEAAFSGQPLADVEAGRRRDLQPAHRKREPEVLELRRRLEEAQRG
jgi:hypothetical protein